MGYRSIKEALDRIEITGITQVIVAAEWVWQKKEAAAWEVEIAAARTERLVVRAKKVTLANTRRESENALDLLHHLTVQGLGMARGKYRQDEGILHSLSLLEAGGHSDQAILDEAAEWRIAWTQLPDSDWEPTPTNTIEIFDAAYTDAEVKLKAVRVATQDERKSRREFYHTLAHLWQDCVEWLIDAELVFEDGTPNGELVRAVVNHRGTNEEDDASETGGDSLPEK